MCDGEGGPPSGPIGDLADLESAVERYSAGILGGRPPREHKEQMIALRQVIDRLELVFAGMTAELATFEELEWEGHRGPVEWVRHECKTWGPVAGNALAVGVDAVRLPESTRAMLRGEIGFAHLALLARTASDIAMCSPGADFRETGLLDLARRHSVGRFRDDCDHARHAADRRQFLEEQVQKVEARSLELRRYQNGCLGLRGFLDPEGGAALRTALEPLAKPAGQDDPRGQERRMADALVELCGHALDAGALPRHAGQRPHLQVTCSLETLRGLYGSVAGNLELGGTIASETVQRLACDAGVTRVVFGSDSTVVDVGRARRVPAPSTRRALQARDGGCVWPGCERPVSWTEAHHLTHWAHGGATDMDNLVLICRHHHWKTHEGGWDLIRDGDRLLILPPMPRELGLPPARAPTVEGR
ncbi:MAG: DUF222 domain-containing protein [Candidatus Dormiibacterota bacterium]